MKRLRVKAGAVSFANVVGELEEIPGKKGRLLTLSLFSNLADLRSQLEGERSSNHPAMGRRCLRNRHGHSRSRR